MTSTSAFSPSASRSRSADMTAKTYSTLLPDCFSNCDVSCRKISLGAPPLITLIVFIDFASALELECLVRAGVEHFLHSHQPRRKTLRMVVTQERLQRLAI